MPHIRANELDLSREFAVRGEQTFVTISEGSIISVTGEVQQSGLVDVLYDGQIVAAYMRDIAARAVLLEASEVS